MSTLSFVGPDWSPKKLVGMVTKGSSVIKKIGGVLETTTRTTKKVKDANSWLYSGIDFLQRKTGEVLKKNILEFNTVRRDFGKLSQNDGVKTDDLFVTGDFNPNEALRRLGKIKDQLPTGWTRDSPPQRVKLAMLDFRLNYHAENIPRLRLQFGSATPPDDAPPLWVAGILYDPDNANVYKTAFDWTDARIPQDITIGLPDGGNLLYIRADESEFKDDPAAYARWATKRTFSREFQCRAGGASGNLDKLKALCWNANAVFLENAFIRPGDLGQYKVEVIDMGETYNPRNKPGEANIPSNWYNPFLKCVQDGLQKGDNWSKDFWAFWWDPDTRLVHGAVWMDTKPSSNFYPWEIHRRAPPHGDTTRDFTKWPVIAFISKEHMPLSFKSFDNDEGVDA
ncbi:hypothetical protein TWF730_007369 [Orbilia blumenaviensis]|uniref:Uncharacterized protein n=1 Tax=Orbilia blumenaviensis TaxID=1796055 RepID=A0AAV9VE11_9PEZI